MSADGLRNEELLIKYTSVKQNSWNDTTISHTIKATIINVKVATALSESN